MRNNNSDARFFLNHQLVAATMTMLAATIVPTIALNASDADAACCSVAKVDTETPALPVRICEPAADGTCGTVLFEGMIDLGSSETVCPAGPTIRYSEWDAEIGNFGAPVDALCDADDVEL